MSTTCRNKSTPIEDSSWIGKRRPIRLHAARRGIALSCFAALVLACVSLLPAQSSAPTTWNVTVMLPRKLIAGQPATLAAFGVDGKLAPGVGVDLGGVQYVQTDKTGRAYFITPPVKNVLIVKASGNFAAALVDQPAAATDPKAAGAHSAISVPPFVSLRDAFAICGPGLRGDADTNRVTINREPALIVAASPDCLSVLPGAKAAPGAGKISVEAPGGAWKAATTFVSLEFEPPDPPLVPERKSELVVRVHGSEQRLSIIAVNETPGVLQYLRGDAEELTTSGGPANFAALRVRAIRSGDYSLHARLVPPPDTDAARRFLEAADPLAGKDLQREIRNLAKHLIHPPRDLEKIRAELNQIVSQTIAGELRALLEAARNAL